MRELPSGTVTFLFTDIAGSTRLLHELGPDAYADALAEHRRLLRSAFERLGGIEVDTQGDAFLFVFGSAPDAVRAAAQGQEALAAGAIGVRMGLHTGSPLLTDEGYVGADLHRAARIASAAHGRQVVVSSVTRALAQDAGAFQDLGDHRLKDLAAPERLWQLGTEAFPPLKSLYRTNLPVPQTPFLGRAEEVAGLKRLLEDESIRLVTLTGPGGTGKTRLALQAAAEASDSFPDGTTWVSLSPLRETTLVLPAIAGALEIAEQPGTELAESLRGAIAGRRQLIVLDNAEHLLPEVATEVVELLRTPGPAILVTSRERLRLAAERAVPVPPLADDEGVDFFTARARAVDPAFAPDGAAAVLCVHLDNLPLALELAAARTALFSPEQLVERLGQRLDLLRGGRDADPRQHTLRATVEWSHDLLAAAEQQLFARLAVFVGGCTYEAAEAICGAEPDALQSLLDKSLLRRRDAIGGPRYWMLETIREYAAERLAEGGDEDRTRDRHARWFARLATGLRPAVRSHDAKARGLIEVELPNLREALAFALDRGDVELAGDLMYGVFFFWLSAGLGHEAAEAARRWLLLDRSRVEARRCVPGLLAAGEIVRFTGAAPAATDLKRELADVLRAAPDGDAFGWEFDRMLAATLSDLAYLEVEQARFEDAEACAVEGLALRQQRGDESGIAHALDALGAVALVRRDFTRAIEVLRRSAASWRAGGHPEEVALTLVTLAEAAVLAGDVETATTELAGAVDGVAATADLAWIAAVARTAAMIAVARGDVVTAAALDTGAERLLEGTGMAAGVRYGAEIEDEFLAAARERRDDEEVRRRLEGDLGADELLDLVRASLPSGGAVR